MLIAHLNGQRVDAEEAERGSEFACPLCRGPMILRRGEIRIAHFAHRPPMNCKIGKGETEAHREAKRMIASGLKSRGIQVEIEYPPEELSRDRIADVMVWRPSDGSRLAIELQHTSIPLDDLQSRAEDYARLGIAQLWIPFLKIDHLARLETSPGLEEFVLKEYRPPPFVRAIFEHAPSAFWFYDPLQNALWQGQMQPVQRYVEEREVFINGHADYVGGYTRTSSAYFKLTLKGPYIMDQLRILLGREHSAIRVGKMIWPKGRYGQLMPLLPDG